MATFERRRYFLWVTDPVHVGTGGYRLGRVDNSIMREPGTRLPKIPGTAVHGAVRSHAARLYENLYAAGQDHSAVPNPDDDPICYSFGYIQKRKDGEDEEPVGYKGVINIFDAQILLFPVSSIAGPVWVTIASRLRDAGFQILGARDSSADAREVFVSWSRTDPLNLGWLMVNVGGTIALEPPVSIQNIKLWQNLKERIVLTHESIFSQIVNSNLEVRTSVSIEPLQGAARDGALFTYEALPRGTLLSLDVVIDDYREGGDSKAFEQSGQGLTTRGQALPGKPWTRPVDVLEAGLNMLAWLGVGGMVTRGFGRLETIGMSVVDTSYSVEER